MFLMANGEFVVPLFVNEMEHILIGSLQLQIQVKSINRKQLIISIKEKRKKYRATAENIDRENGYVTLKINEIASTSKNGQEIVTCKFKGNPGGYIRWNIEFLD